MKRLIFPLLIALFVAVSFAPTVYEIAHSGNVQPNRQFELVHNFYTDYNFYLSRIRQGLEGRWTAVERYTSEPHEGSFLHVLYVAMGQAGRWVRVPLSRAGDVYHVARLVLAVALLALIARFCRQNVLAFLLAVTAGSWPTLVFFNGGWRFGGYMSWWSLMDTLQRITFIPHLLAGQALILFLVIALRDENVRKRPTNWLFLGVIAFLLGIIFPPGVIFLGAMLGIAAGIEWLWSPAGRIVTQRWAGWTVLPYGVVLAFAVPALLYLNLMTSFYPWKRLTEFDIINPLPFNYIEYAKALGPILPLGIIGLIVAFIKKERNMLFPIAWVTGWIVLLIVFRFIPQQSPLRFSEMMPQVPLAVLMIYLLYQMGRRFSFIIYHLSFIILLLLGIGQMYSSYLWQKDFVDHKMRAGLPLVPTGSYVMYPLKDFIDAIRFVQDNSAPDAVILSETTAGNYIPVYAGRTVYVGHANTVRAEEKQVRVNTFFRGAMKAPEAQQFLTEERIGLVFFGPQERQDGGLADLRMAYPFLTQVYSNPYVAVYKTP